MDLAKGLTLSLKALRNQGAPRHLLKGLKKFGRVIGSTSAHKMYEKMFVSMLQDDSCFKAHKALNDWSAEGCKEESSEFKPFQNPNAF